MNSAGILQDDNSWPLNDEGNGESDDILMADPLEDRDADAPFFGAGAQRQSKLIKALDLWREITGVDPEATTHTFGSWSLRETFKELQEAIDLDPSEITASLLLGYLLNSYLRERSVNLLTMLNDPKGVASRLVKPRELMDLLNAADLVEARDNFSAAINEALGTYGAADRPEVQKFLAAPDNIALLRRDALRALSKLRVDQFLDGAPEPSDVRPVYNRTVHQWWNVNSMLAASAHRPSGVSLNLIRHPDGMHSYFCFVIRNGGNLFTLSDVPNYAHPLQAMMSRRPERELERRASRNWFPYDLLGLDYDEESGELYLKQTEQRGLVAYQNAALPLKPIAELPPAELVWISMMFDLIVDKFWERAFKAPELSYTAEMLRSQDALIEHAKTANLPVAAYQRVGLPALTKADVAAGAVTDAEVGDKLHEPNRWLEERYAAQVPDEALNLIAAPEKSFALDHKTGEISATNPGFHALQSWQRARELGDRIALAKLDATTFGSREKIEADRKFIARSNFASQVGALAIAEFEEREAEVKAWYAEKVKANAPALLRWCANNSLWIDDGMHGTFTHYDGIVGPTRTVGKSNGGGIREPRRTLRQFLGRYELENSPWERRYNASGVLLGTTSSRGKLLCHLNGTAASYWVGIYPANSRELALICGCLVSDLPDVLQHWDLLRTYTGNHILDRIDPMIWKASNPWIELKLSVLIPLSIRGLARVDKGPVERPALESLLEISPE